MGLRALTSQPGFGQVRGIVLGRFARNAEIDRERMTAMNRNIPAMAAIPVIANCDFGHATPLLTLPIGGHCLIQACGSESKITMETH